MKPSDNKKPLIQQGWLRALLFTVFYILLLTVAGVVLRLSWNKPATEANGDQLFYLQFLINAALSLLVVWLFRTQVDRRSFTSMGFEWTKNGAHAGTGFFTGVALVCGGTLVLSFTHHLEWTGSVFNGNDLFISFGLMAIVALYEEAIFRGYILNNLMESAGKWVALPVSALVFALAHSGNPGFSLLAALNIFIAGLLLGVNYIYTKNCWFGVLLHFSWNFFQGPILGYPVSGVRLQSLFQQDRKGSEWITGGAFGFEGSAIAAVFLALAITGLIIVYERKFRPVAAA
ncbi:MAG TPA: type II CAAX endopeptidase family protein [Chitinophagaceae bacterium]|nr:type II CAAX endopeptidase family protein [Chitinophagaceae bacterium]